MIRLYTEIIRLLTVAFIVVWGTPIAFATELNIPVVDGLSSTKVRAGEMFKVTGRGFLPRELWYGGPPIRINGEYAYVEGWADDRIYARALRDTEPGRHMLIAFIERVPSKPVYLEILPAIENVAMESIDGYESIVVTGGAFGKEPGTVSLNGTAVKPILWTSTRLIIPPKVVAGEVIVKVEKNGYAASRTFELPLAISKVLLHPRLKETLVALQGERFGSSADRGEVRIRDQVMQIRDWSMNEVVAVVDPQLPAGKHPLVVRVGPAVSRVAAVEVVPVIRSLSYADGRPGDTLELFGAHFPSKTDEVTVRIGDQLAEVLSAEPGKLRVQVPAGLLTGEHLIRVSVSSGDHASPGVAFKVLPKGKGIVRFEEFGDGW